MPKDDAYTLKEMLQEVRSQNQQALSTQAAILVRVENIDKHLEKLNSKVALHEKKLYSLSSFQTKAATIWAIAVVLFTTFANQVIANLGL